MRLCFAELNMADKHIAKVEPEEEQVKEVKDGQDKSAKAIELLREVTMLLSDGSEGEPGKPEDQNPHIRVIGQPYSQSQGQLGASRVLNNFRSVFAPYSRPPPAPLTSSIQPRRAKPLKPRQGGCFFQPKE